MKEKKRGEEEKKWEKGNYTLVKSPECFQNRWEKREEECILNNWVCQKETASLCMCLSLLIVRKDDQISQTFKS